MTQVQEHWNIMKLKKWNKKLNINNINNIIMNNINIKKIFILIINEFSRTS